MFMALAVNHLHNKYSNQNRSKKSEDSIHFGLSVYLVCHMIEDPVLSIVKME